MKIILATIVSAILLIASCKSTTIDCADFCCEAMTAECLACDACMTVEDYCKKHPKTAGCD